MNNLLSKYLNAASKNALKNSPEILARVSSDIAKLEAEAFAEASAIFKAQQEALEKLEATKQEGIKKQQVLESEKRLSSEIAATEKLKTSQFSDGITVKSNIEFDPNRKTYPVAIQTKPVDIFKDVRNKPQGVSSSTLAEAFGGLSPVETTFDFGLDRLKLLPSTEILDDIAEESLSLKNSLFSNTITPPKTYSPGIGNSNFTLTNPTEETILRNTAVNAPIEKQSIYNNPLQGSFDFNAEIKRRVTGNQRIPVTHVVEEATLPTWLPKAPITIVEDQSKQEESILKNAELLREQKRAEQVEALRLKNEASAASAVQTQTMNTGNIQDHANNRRSFSDLSKANLFSFDTETSGVNPKTAQIWQYGYAERLADSSSFTGSDYHVNPFGNKSLVAQDLIDMNGDFSKKAFKRGNFTGILQDAVSGLLEKNTHTGGLLETLARVNTGSILVMQNMDFENNLLREAFERGDYKQSVFTDLQNKMATSVLDSRLERTNNLLQRPSSVEGIMREADFTYHTQFSKYRDESSFKKYAGLLNQAFDEYDSIIKTTTSSSKIPVIELMDISKTFLANLGANNLIEKETSMLGLNIDFLTRSFYYGRVEDHTAFSDSKDTIELFEDMFRHTKDMRNGIITDELKELAGRIKGNQAGEVNRRFVASVSSTIQDFITRGYTKGRASKDSYYTPEQILRDNETNKIRDLPKISIGTKAKQTVTSLEEALNSQIAKYQDMYVDDIDGFSRQGFVKDLLSLFDEEAKNYEDVKTKMNSIVIPSTNSNTVQGSSIVAKKEGVLASTFNSKNSKVVMGLAAVAGLGYMAFAPGPKQIEEQNQDLPVYSNFYDEQYLGTGFVEFRERNKRYVY